MGFWEISHNFVYVVVGYLVIYIIRQIWFHPLSNYPGPKLAAITMWYKAYYELVVGGRLLAHIEELHKQYGPVIRIGPNELHFTSGRAYHQIYAPGSPYPKESWFYDGFNLKGTSFGETEVELAKTRREMLAPLFSRRAILKLERIVQENVDLLIRELVKYNGKPANLFLAIRCATLDIISSYCFSYSFDALKAPGFEDPLILSQHKAVHYMWFLKYFPFLHRLTDTLTKHFGDSEILIGNTIIQKQVTALVDLFLDSEDALENAEHEIIYHHLIRPQSEKTNQRALSRKELAEEGQVLLGAGSETVASTLIWGAFRILGDKELLRNLCSELREAWPDKDQHMAYSALERLPYLSAVVKESLRITGGIITPLPRVVTSDVLLDRYLVPKGTIVSASHIFLHFDPTVFPDPYTFKPERWLQPNASVLENNLVPFSRGPRMCLGVNLAWCELYLLFANLFRKLDMEIYETDLSDFEYKDILVPILLGRQFHATVREKVD